MELKKIHMSDIGKVVTGKTPRTSIVENYGDDIPFLPFLTPSDDLSYKSVPKTGKTLTEQGLKEVKNCLLPPYSVCVSCIGSDLGKVVMTSEPTITNQGFSAFFFLLWQYPYDKKVMFVYENGSNGLKNLNINSLIERELFVIPPKDVISRFNLAVAPLLSKKQTNGVEVARLTSLRNTSFRN